MEALVQWLALVVSVLALIISVLASRHAALSYQSAAFLEIIKQWREYPDVRAEILQHYPRVISPNEMDQDQSLDFREYIALLNGIAYLTIEKKIGCGGTPSVVVPRKWVIELFGVSIAKTWHQVEGLVAQWRISESHSELYLQFEGLAKECSRLTPPSPTSTQ